MPGNRMLFIRWSDTEFEPYDDLIPEEWVNARKPAKALIHEVESRTKDRSPARCDLLLEKDAIVLDYAGGNKKFNEDQGMALGSIVIHFKAGTREVKRVSWREVKGSPDQDVRSIPFEWQVVTAPEDDGLEDEEGGLKLAAHRSYERSARLRRAKVKAVLRLTGKLACEACDFEFSAVYGPDLGSEFCEVHHTRPLAGSGSRVTKQTDLVVVCSNCHRMIHRSVNRLGEMLRIDQLRDLITRARTGHAAD